MVPHSDRRLSLSLHLDLVFRQPGEQRGIHLVRLTQLLLVLRVLGLVSGQLLGALYFESFVLLEQFAHFGGKFDMLLPRVAQLPFVVLLHLCDFGLGLSDELVCLLAAQVTTFFAIGVVNLLGLLREEQSLLQVLDFLLGVFSLVGCMSQLYFSFSKLLLSCSCVRLEVGNLCLEVVKLTGR